MLLREIQVFRTVMTCATASKAARLLNISQPAVSQALRRLEAHAEVALFQRLRGRLHPTAEAYALLSEVDRCFVGMDAIEHRLRSLKQFSGGRLSIASMPALGVEFLPRALGKMDLFGKQHAVSLQIMSSREVRERVISRQCNIGLMADEVSTIGLEHSVFSKLEGVIVMPAAHPLAKKSIISPGDIHRQPFISLNPEDTSQRQFQAILDAHEAVPTPAMETPYAFSVCELVRHGLGLGLVNPISALDYTKRGVTIRPFSEPIIFTSLLALPADQQLSQFSRSFLSVLRMQLSEDLKVLEGLLAHGPILN
jgi:DNA-binding transcriptional LysR family regulator